MLQRGFRAPLVRAVISRSAWIAVSRVAAYSLDQQVTLGQRGIKVVVAEGRHGDQLDGLARGQSVAAVEQARADRDGDRQFVRNDPGSQDAVVWLR